MLFGQTVAKLILGAGLALPLIAGSAAADIQDLLGIVSYRERVALPPEALVEITLEDVSKMDVASVVLARQVLKPEGQVPIAFRLAYDDGMVAENGRYSVRAIIQVGEDVLWRSTQSFAALTQNAPEEVEVMVERMPSRGDVDLTIGSWLVVVMNGEVVQSERVPQIEFDADGRVSGSSGCNRFTGSYTRTGDRLSFGPLASTRMACSDELNAQETAFFKTLTQVSSVGIMDGGTVLIDERGAVVMRFLAE
ncbi:META domain-containing protein [Shimia sp. R9_1]|uniref:META domain-containing protein n=1 Tax=Shimia sp. R9_1 TaxID=2821111 RepID=UPI001ADC307C|nr:META domain-containing protein [Shimia sp. R9_1]MBO9406649.1 META domain-containing protein [Shimia sp. R9_1]